MFKYFEAIEELPKELKTPIVRVLELFREEIAETVKKSDFERFERATEENFKRVWRAIEGLAEAQKRTEEEVRRLAIEVNDLRIGQENLRKEVGGFARSSGYAFENEAYRMLPKTLKERYGIELKERLIRKVIDDSEINILGSEGTKPKNLTKRRTKTCRQILKPSCLGETQRTMKIPL